MRVQLGGEDWVARYSAQARAGEGGERLGDRWRDRAARFDRMSRRALGSGGTIEGLEALVRREDVVLDIGAGTGRHAIPLARQCARLVAVEPSEAMRTQLAARVAEEGVTNLEIREESWPFADTPQVDVAYSAHVVYGVAELDAFVGAMTRSARRTCALLLKLRAPSDLLTDLYEAIHGARRPRRPAALEAFAVLHQLGFAASLTMVEGSERPMTFRDDEEDLREVALRVGLAPDAEGLTRVRAALERTCAREGDGWCVGSAGASALLTWAGAG
jgi:SAM-dependent methyltransferase